MKKLSLLICLLATFVLTSCQTNPSINESNSDESESQPIESPSESETESDEESESEYIESESEFESESEPESENKGYLPKTVEGFTYIENSELVYDQFTDSAPHEGEANMLVIPLEFKQGNPKYTKIDWTGSNKAKIKNLFFGSNEEVPDQWRSLKTYFEEVSKNDIEVNGMVTDVYEVPSPYTFKYIIENETHDMSLLHQVFADSIDWVKQNHTDVDWSQYDMNQDGNIDNLHFITNTSYLTTLEGEISPFWPHAWTLPYNSEGTPENPTGYTYEATSLGHIEESSQTLIHEQGHVFGVEDYYDVSYHEPEINYVGSCDMQSLNIFDWNSFSKFSVGWANPYYFDGSKDSATITIESAALTNECIVVPADPKNYNKSAFSEYFLIELFTNDGVNEKDWNEYFNRTTFGIRLYHVDARVYWYTSYDEETNSYDGEVVDTTQDVIDLAKNGYGVRTGANNAYDYRDYTGVKSAADFKLLSLIQRGAEDTFGTGKRPLLNEMDLFYTGDIFTFERYSHFLSKSGQKVTTMNNGETFPYEISFDEVAHDSATITISFE